MKKSILILLIVITNSLSAQVTLLDENFSTGIPATWTTVDVDANTPANAIYSNAWIGFTSAFDTCAASTSSYIDSNGNEDTSAISADYLITPKINLLTFGNLLSWDAKSLDGSYPDGYEVLISTTDSLTSSFQTILKTVDSEIPYWKHYSINLTLEGYNNQAVYIAFKNITKNGFVLQLDNIKVTGDDPAKLIKNDLRLKIYPNPIQNILNVEVDNFQSLELINMNGQLILSSNNSSVNTSDLEKGVYFLKVKTENSIVTKKIIK